MTKQIINFPASRITLTGKLSQTHAFKGISSTKADLPILLSNEYLRFDNILSDEKLAEEMFPPDYFMLVE